LRKANKMGMLNLSIRMTTRTDQQPQMNMKRVNAILLSLMVCAGLSGAQAPAPAPAVSYASIAELNQLIANLQQTSQAAQLDLARMRIERWKTDSGTKQQTQKDSASIAQNLQLALPGMLDNLKNSPENLALTFKVYHNLDALYDVFTSVVESAGAFGSKEDFQSLNKDLGAIEDSRRAFADRMDKLANAKETELGQLRLALQQARADAAPKKVVVDDTAPPPKKTAPHKKPTAKPTTPKPSTTSPSSSSPSQAPPAQPHP